MTTAGAVTDLHAFGRSPHSSTYAYVVSNRWNLFWSDDSGANWHQINSAPPGSVGCGGVSFIKAVPRLIENEFPTPRYGLELYFGNRCGLARLKAPFSLVTGDPFHGLQWETLSIDHDDTRDIAFDSQTNPLLLGTDGGLEKPTNSSGRTWHYTGGGRDGFNALQITEVKGQYIRDIGRHDLYFGTQDNKVWASGDGGSTWPGSVCCEGFFIEAERYVATASSSKITANVCGTCHNEIFDPLLTNKASWPMPPGNVNYAPMIFKDSTHVQGVDDLGGFSKGLAATNTYGASWRQWVSFSEDIRAMPKLVRVSGRNIPGIVYQAYKISGSAVGANEINCLMRITGYPSTVGPDRVIYPAITQAPGRKPRWIARPSSSHTWTSLKKILEYSAN